jgi:hypothetical protein
VSNASLALPWFLPFDDGSFVSLSPFDEEEKRDGWGAMVWYERGEVRHGDGDGDVNLLNSQTAFGVCCAGVALVF